MKKKQIIIDYKIINSFRKGELWAFELIYQEISSFIFNVAYKMINSQQETEDLTHDIFVKLYNNACYFNESIKFTIWAYQIAVNDILKHLNRKKNLFRKFIDFLFYNNSVFNSDVNKIEYEDNTKTFYETFLCIKPEFRICLILREFEGQSYHEIADILKINLSLVKYRINCVNTELFTKVS